MAAVVAIGITGCTVGPDFKRPAPLANARYQSGGAPRHTASSPGKDGEAQVFARADTVRGDWYRLFHSQKLDHLIATALKNSPTIVAGQARLAAAHEAVKIANGGRLPRLDAGVNASRNKLTGVEFGIQDPEFANTYWLYEGQLSLGYDVDPFGKHRREVESQKARYAEQQYRLLDTALTLVDNVVGTALTQAGLRAGIHAIRRIAKTQHEALEIVSKRERIGAATPADTARAHARLATTQAQLPTLQKQLRLAHNRLALLVGQTPGAFKDPGFTLADLSLPKQLPLSMPSALVAQRPDILAAVSRMHWASARIGVADANLLPDIRLDASYSRAALTAGALADPLSVLYNVGLGLTAPLFHGGALRARKRAAQDRYRAVAADYRNVVLTAFQQVSDSLAALQQDAKILTARRASLAAARESRDIVRKQVEGGAATYLSLFEAQTLDQKALLKAVDARVQRYRDSATLLRALGGGWWHKKQSPLAVAAELTSSTPGVHR